jgi:putative pyruvate formate lyase activating enzyme
MYPSYLNLTKKELEERIERLFKILERCEICPKRCRVNRLKEQRGFCRLGYLSMVSAYHHHFGEESVLLGRYGSGPIFLSGCNLHCVYCQNYEISQWKIGKEVSFERLAEMMIELQNLGCHNLNFVTPLLKFPKL